MKFKVVKPIPEHEKYKDKVLHLCYYGLYGLPLLSVDDKLVAFYPQELEEVKEMVKADKGKVVVTFNVTIKDWASGYDVPSTQSVFLTPQEAMCLAAELPKVAVQAEQARRIKEERRRELESELRALDN